MKINKGDILELSSSSCQYRIRALEDAPDDDTSILGIITEVIRKPATLSSLKIGLRTHFMTHKAKNIKNITSSIQDVDPFEDLFKALDKLEHGKEI